MKSRPKVFVINNSTHDYSPASKYGEIVYLTSGQVDSYDTNKNFRIMYEKLKDIKEGDYILVTSLASLNIIVGWVIGIKKINLNLLIYKKGQYLVRRLVYKEGVFDGLN